MRLDWCRQLISTWSLMMSPVVLVEQHRAARRRVYSLWQSTLLPRPLCEMPPNRISLTGSGNSPFRIMLIKFLTAVLSFSSGVSWAASLSGVIIIGLCGCTEYVSQANANAERGSDGSVSAGVSSNDRSGAPCAG